MARRSGLGRWLRGQEGGEGGPKTLLASGARIRMDDRGDALLLMRTRQPWQQLCLNYLKVVGELHYVACDVIGDSLSKLRIFAAELPEDPDAPPVPTEDETAIQEAARFDSGAGWAGIMRKAAIHLMVPGECYLTGLTDDDGAERWSVKSINELKAGSDGSYELITLPALPARKLEKDEAAIVRIWLEDPEYGMLADSPTRSVMEHLEALVFLEKAKRSQAKSRIPMGKILTIPNELAGTGPFNATKGGQDSGEERKDPYMAMLEEAMVTPIQDEGSAAAVMPILLRGPAAAMHPDALRVIDVLKPFDEGLQNAINQALQRFGQGMPVPPEIIQGIADVNHWGAWQIDESNVKHIEPVAIAILDAITDGAYRPALAAREVENPNKFLLWYDTSKLVTHPNRAADAKEAHAALAISDEALRKALGFGDDDAPDEEELARRAAIRLGTFDPANTANLLAELFRAVRAAPIVVSTESPALPPGGGDEEPEPPEPPAEPGPPGTGPEAVADREVAASNGAPKRRRKQLGERLTDIDRNLRVRLATAADSAVRRMLEKQGARLRTKATAKRVGSSQRAVIASAPDIQVAQLLGPALVAQLDPPAEAEWLKAFDQLRSQFDRWVDDAQVEAVAALKGLGKSAREELEKALARARDEAWLWLRDGLVALTKEALYGTEIAAIGELDPTTLVPAGLIRQALARAGGAEDLIETSGFVASLPSGEPVGGVAFGELIKEALQGEGAAVEGYEWVYGPFPRRTFDPHLELDGVIFENFDDPVLANTTGFPAAAFFYPGDHAGCMCDVVPVVVAPQIFPEPVQT